MINSWKIYKLSDFMDFNPTETITKGVIAKKVSMEVLKPFCRDILKYENEEYFGGAKFRNGDTIMARITPCLENGKRAFVNILNENEVGFGSTEYIVLRAKENISDAKFIYYLVSSNLIRDPAIKSMVGSSGRQRVQTDVLKSLEISLPPLNIQKKIARILGALDNKIELNNRMNQNLESQAKTLFKSWFVDKEYNVLENTTLGNICKCKLGGTPSRAKPEYWNGNIAWINSGEVNNFRITKASEYITELGLQKSATKLLPKKTTILAITGATLGQISLLEIDSCANQSVVGVLENDILPYEFIYPFICYNIQDLISHQTGGAQQHINKQNVESLPLALPTKEIIDSYRKIVKPIFDMIAKNCFENEKLIAIRDALLPKLMSGEIDVENIPVSDIISKE